MLPHQPRSNRNRAVPAHLEEITEFSERSSYTWVLDADRPSGRLALFRVSEPLGGAFAGGAGEGGGSGAGWVVPTRCPAASHSRSCQPQMGTVGRGPDGWILEGLTQSRCARSTSCPVAKGTHRLGGVWIPSASVSPGFLYQDEEVHGPFWCLDAAGGWLNCRSHYSG
jgi:hypothetical protein